MDPRTLSICIGAIALAATGFYYGVKFCKIRNYLIGIEWFALATSSTNFMIYELTHSPINYVGVEFLDTFSRAFGLPIVTVAGMMVLTHRFKPSISADVILFVLPSLGTLALLTNYFSPDLKYILLIMWSFFTIYLIYFATVLHKYGEKLHAFGIVCAAVSNQTIAYMYDFYKIPGDATNVFLNFYTIALYVWSYLTIQVYYSYCALQRAMKSSNNLPGTTS